jgi:hypothetical protein
VGKFAPPPAAGATVRGGDADRSEPGRPEIILAKIGHFVEAT